MEAGSNTVVIVGAGPSGIASALALKDTGLRPLLIDRADNVGSAWRGRYDRLTLNTARQLSHLPGRPYPKGTPVFPSRDQVVQYLERHAQEDGIDLLLDTSVDCIDRNDGTWLLWTSAGKIHTRQLIIATGYDNTPHLPEWRGRSSFARELLHSSEYRNAEAYRGKPVLVVGSGNSGMEIAHDLAEGGASKVWLSVRTPPNIMPLEGPVGELFAALLYQLPLRVADAVTRFGRRMNIGDLTEHGLPVPEEGVFSRLQRLGAVPAILDEDVIESVKQGRVEVVAAVDSLDRAGVRLVDSARLEPEAVICATGYRRGLEPMVGHLGVLGENGVPKALAPKAAAPGLRFVGYVPRPAGIFYMGKDAKRTAKAIRADVRAAGVTRPQPATASVSARS
jgi:cation diffusion facilitator CzcD-associated flavoprotein CzcO